MIPATLRLMINSSHDCVIVTDGDFNIQAHNRRCPRGNLSCPSFRIDLSAGRPLREVLGSESLPLISQAGGSGWARGCVSFISHGHDSRVEVTLSRIDEASVFVAHLRDITDSVAEAARLELVAREMRHRLSNAFSIALAVLGASGDRVAPEARRRLSALGRIQSLKADDMAMADLLRLLSSTVVDLPVTVSSSAPDDLQLTLSQSQTIMLVLGELAANSLKHGAFFHGGRVSIEWILGDGELVFVWTESSPCPPVRAERDDASGFRIMSQMVRLVRGNFIDEWPRTGLKVTMRLPVQV